MTTEPLRRRVQEVVEQQGWTNNTLCDLAINFIHETGEGADFVGYLKDIADQENSGYTEVPQPQLPMGEE